MKRLNISTITYLAALVAPFVPAQAMAQPSQGIENHSSYPSQTTENSENMEVLKISSDLMKKPNWSEQETKNVAVVADFIQHLMNDHDFEYVRKTYGNNPYVQHNRNITDGMEALVSYVERFAKRYPDYTYDVKHIYVDGNMVIFHSHATTKKKHRGNDKKGLNIIDTWKVEDGKIADHWDAVQPMSGFMRFFVMMTGGKIRNTNGVY